MMGECRAKGRGTWCPAEVGKVQHRILQVKWGGWDSQAQSRCKWIHEISYEGLWGVLPASPDEGWGIRVWAGRKAQGRTRSPALAQLHSLPAAFGAGFLLLCRAPNEGIPWLGRSQ